MCVCGGVSSAVWGNSVWSSGSEVQGTQNKKPRQMQGERERRVMADRNRRRTEREREGESERE